MYPSTTKLIHSDSFEIKHLEQNILFRLLVLCVACEKSQCKTSHEDLPSKQTLRLYLLTNEHMWPLGFKKALPSVRKIQKYQIFLVFTSAWSKLKIVTIQWIMSRIWDTIDDWHINNLAKNQVSVVFHLHVICKSVSPKFIELCIETPCFCPKIFCLLK